jgi:hypothetical protein
MKRMLQWLARLYPEAWRARYGAEYEALLEEREARVRDVVDVAWTAAKMWAVDWRLARVVLPCVVVGGVVAVAISFTVQPEYVSRQFIRGGVVDRGSRGVFSANQQPAGEEMRHMVMMRDEYWDTVGLGAIIDDLNLYPQERARMSRQAVIAQMSRDISIRLVAPSPSSQGVGGIALAFNYPDPHVAQRVLNELVSRLITGNLHFRSEAAQAGSQRVGMVFVIQGPPTLADQPAFPRRSRFGAAGLLAGLAGGLVLAGAIRWSTKLGVNSVRRESRG